MARLSFELFKLTKDQDYLVRDDLVHFCKRIAQLDENFVNLYYKRTGFDPRIPIYLPDFIKTYENVMVLSLFGIVRELTKGFKEEHLNMDGMLYSEELGKSLALNAIVQTKHD